MNCAWVTLAHTEEDARRCVPMVESLKKAQNGNGHATVLIMSSRVSHLLRDVLLTRFDKVVVVNDEEVHEGLAKVIVKLESFQKCAFVTPAAVFLKSGSEVFERSNEKTGLAMSTDGSLFVLKPSLANLKSILGKGAKEAGALGKLLQDQFLENWDYLPEQFIGDIWLTEDKVICLDEKECIIAKFKNDPINFLSNWDSFNPAGLQNSPQYLDDIRKWLEAYKSTFASPKSPPTCDNNEAIAIVGMSCRFPGANNYSEFWDVLINGRDATANPPSFRWLPEDSPKYWPDCRKINAGFLKTPVDQFDRRFFNVLHDEAVRMDPQVRMLHELVWEGLEDAAIDPSRLSGSNTGVFVGSWKYDYMDVLASSTSKGFYKNYMVNSIGAGAARISNFFGFTGPNVATESGCSSSMVAVHLACKSLQRQESNLAVACGVNLLLNPFDKVDFPIAVSDEGHCKTFDVTADGYGRADGCGVLVLKRMSDAIASKDHIWAVIRGSGVAQEGLSQHMGTPTVHSEALAMKNALQDARVSPDEVTYVEMHGTGTQVGDPIEVEAVSKAYASRNRASPLIIGSVKTNINHTEATSGIAGIMKVALSLKNEVIPSHRGFTTLNPNIDLDSVPASIPTECVDWKKTTKKRLAGVSSFGITGTDAHLIIEEPPEIRDLAKTSLQPNKNILKFSAKTEQALDALIAKYGDYLRSTEDALKDIAYTGNVSRTNFPWRAALLAETKEQAVSCIEGNSILRGVPSSEDQPGKLCFLFTGQGSQYPGMAKQLYETCSTFRENFDHCEGILRTTYDIHLRDVLWGEGTSSDQIKRTIYSQTSIFCVEYALFKVWESLGVQPDYVLGHSLGEFGAAVAAGILTIDEAIMLVAERSRLTDALPPGKMLVVKGDQGRVTGELKTYAGTNPTKILDVAAVNSEEQTVLAGDSDVVQEFAEYCSQKGLKCVVLEATHAFHSKHMDPILEAYGKLAASITKKRHVHCGYISGVRGTLVEGSQVGLDYWLDHTREKVNFLPASRTAFNELGCTTFLEVGPQPVLAAMVMMNNSGNQSLECIPSIKKGEDNWTTLLTAIGKLYTGGRSINWRMLGQPGNKVSLPHYPFLGKKYWPEMSSSGNYQAVHPLMGKLVPTATPSPKIFQSELKLKDIPYIKDHLIGTNVIFPGAGFLETCLAAAYTAFEGEAGLQTLLHQGGSRPFTVENLRILAPFRLAEKQTCPLQTLVDFTDSGTGATLKVFHQPNSSDGGKWLQNIEAQFDMMDNPQEEIFGDFNAERVLSLANAPSTHDYLPKDMYQKFASTGLNLGPAFRVLDKCWRDEEGGLLIQINIPNDHSNYLVHPTVLDGMVQTAFLHRYSASLKGKLWMPVQIGKFTWICKFRGDTMFVYAYTSKFDNTSCAVLIDGRGRVLGKMSRVEGLTTHINMLESVLEQQTSPMPQLWEDSWKQQPLAEGSEPGIEDGRKTTWVVFHTTSPLVEGLVGKLKSAGSHVIFINSKSHYQSSKVDQDSFSVENGTGEEVTDVMKAVLSRRDFIEGVLYAWPLNPSITSQSQLLEPWFSIAQSLSIFNEKRSFPKLVVLTSGAVPVGDCDLSHFHSSTIWGLTKSLKNENFDLSCRCIDIPLEEINNNNNNVDEKTVEQVFNEMMCTDKEVQVAYRGGIRYIPRFQSVTTSPVDLALPAGSNHFKLELPESKLIQDIRFVPLVPCGSLGGNEVEIEVKAYSLNFKDVLNIIKPTEEFKELNTVGIDYAGVVRRVGAQVKAWSPGDLVFGGNPNGGTFSSHVVDQEENFIRVPGNMTIAQAVTLPAAFVTAYHCLVQIAKLQLSDTILIHTASGGVGLAAIQIAKHLGAKIIATAGSKRKRRFLREVVGLTHVFNSRNVEYSQKIGEVTSDRGVTVVLNSLTSEGFKEASLKVCADGARFVEMSKLNVWQPQEIQKLRPDVSYEIIDATRMSPETWTLMMKTLNGMINRKIVSPLPYVRFDGVHLRQALEYMQKTKHVGKVICIMPEWKRNPQKENAITTPMFNDRSTYLITGGLGGIGLEVAKWMVQSGAKNLLLAGRRPPSEVTQSEISRMNREGGNVVPIQLDVGSYSQVKQLLDEIESPEGMNLPPLRGVMHAAGTLADGLIVNQSWDRFSSTLNAKVNGTLNLHELTRNCDLEHFVVFSSVVSLMGTPGQGNHAAGNSFQDALVHYRHSMGLKATSVNWGPWGEVGVAKDIELPGMKPLSTLQGIAALEYVMKQNRTQTCAVTIDSFVLLGKRVPQLETYLDDRVRKSTGNRNGLTSRSLSSLESTEYWQQYNSQQGFNEKLDIVKTYLNKILHRLLRLDEGETIGDSSNFQDIGVDSLMYVEISNSLQTLFGKQVPISVSALRDFTSISALSSYLVSIIEGESKNAEPSVEEIRELIRRDCVLPEHITAEGMPVRGIASVKTVLVTGATGFLVPFILRELTNTVPQVERIYCLVRSRNGMSGEERMLQALEYNGLTTSINLEIVQCVEGDVGQPKLGMSDEIYDLLKVQVDAVIHCAAKVDYGEYYKDRAGLYDDIRAVGIGGTKRILEFSCDSVIKHVFFSSSLLGLAKIDENGTFSENWQEVEDFDGVNLFAYPNTKHVCDVLMRQAVERGLPCKIFRFPFITGESSTGRFADESNHYMFRCLYTMKTGLLPRNYFPLTILPVDKCAEIATKLFFDERVPYEPYNIVHPNPGRDSDFQEMCARFGKQMKLVEYSEFVKHLLEDTTPSPFHLFREFYTNPRSYLSHSRAALRTWFQGKDDFFRSRKVASLLPSFFESLEPAATYLERDILFAKDQGHFDKFEI